jgi:hypothetical protein
MTTHLHPVPRLRMVELYLHSPYVFTVWYLIKPKITLRIFIGILAVFAI